MIVAMIEGLKIAIAAMVRTVLIVDAVESVEVSSTEALAKYSLPREVE
jgi:hypothetical protein